jgi:hypothetical protein
VRANFHFGFDAFSNYCFSGQDYIITPSNCSCAAYNSFRVNRFVRFIITSLAFWMCNTTCAHWQIRRVQSLGNGGWDYIVLSRFFPLCSSVTSCKMSTPDYISVTDRQHVLTLHKYIHSVGEKHVTSVLVHVFLFWFLFFYFRRMLYHSQSRYNFSSRKKKKNKNFLIHYIKFRYYTYR